ncbi:MAG: methyltransferase domain-containing protein [Clostridia bacterium]
MRSYEHLATSYDAFTDDVNYAAWADYFEREFAGNVKSVLDLACGTGSLTEILLERGFDVTAVDASSDMLAIAAGKAPDALFLCQSMETLDLYGTVDAAICCLDSFNYLADYDAFARAIARLRFFISPGGLLIFDLNTDAKFKTMDGEVYLRDSEEHFCVWSADYNEETRICRMDMDIFDKKGELWQRSFEEHIERAHSDAEVRKALDVSGFDVIRTDEPFDAGRVFYIARRRAD